ncbi:hypothetical protein OH491_06100 [Termitidicoccus mucosus]|uniref:Phytase-like domain-containing protein n=1 Tax=Termitidicoccus mucosus TaxID=1184151 RepID=A0A178IG68_9BACT|nr:hypothetical protein AW736_18870 [Opitutaceae bacterium TSB47]
MKPNKTKTHPRGAAAFSAARALVLAVLAATGALATATAAGTGAAAPTLEHPFVGTYKKEAQQGMAIHKDTAFLFNNTGIVRMYNLKTKEFINDYLLDTAAPENHANCANFGVEFPEGNSAYPALYVSECYGQRRCFVQSVSAAGAKLIQTLKVRRDGKSMEPLTADYSFDWYVDKDGKFLYFAAITHDAKNRADESDYLITKVRLPALSEGDVTFTEKDFLDRFTISFRHLSQGGVIRGDRLYMPVGCPKPAGAKKDPADRALIVVDLGKRKIEKIMDFSKDLTLEPEDADFHGDKLLMVCGQDGGLWHVKGI